MCACLVLRRTKWDSAMACLAKLHWLPIRQHITFKICVLTYKLLHKQGPRYLQVLLQYKHNISNRTLRSNLDQSLLVIPHTKCKTFASRSFSVAAPTLWNHLPRGLRELNTLLSFKRDLKTHLYKEAFGNPHPQSSGDLWLSIVPYFSSTSSRNMSITSLIICIIIIMCLLLSTPFVYLLSAYC